MYSSSTTGLHYGVCTQLSRDVRGVRGVVIWLTEMEKRENNSRAVPMLRFGRMVWLKKILMQGMAWILIWCKPHRCVQGMLYTHPLHPPFHLHTYDVRAADVVYDWEAILICWVLTLLADIGGASEGELCMGGTQERHKGGDLQEAYCSQARSISNIAVLGCSQPDTGMDWIISFSYSTHHSTRSLDLNYRNPHIFSVLSYKILP